jgi:hypothetical protein
MFVQAERLIDTADERCGDDYENGDCQQGYDSRPSHRDHVHGQRLAHPTPPLTEAESVE